MALRREDIEKVHPTPIRGKLSGEIVEMPITALERSVRLSIVTSHPESEDPPSELTTSEKFIAEYQYILKKRMAEGVNDKNVDELDSWQKRLAADPKTYRELTGTIVGVDKQEHYPVNLLEKIRRETIGSAQRTIIFYEEPITPHNPKR